MLQSVYQRAWRGFSSLLGMLLFPIGWWWCRSIDHFATPERMKRGCVFVLPGIQGKSPIEFGVARGLDDAGIDLGIAIFDWTTGLWPLFLFHLRAPFWHRRMAKKLVATIVQYQSEHPDRPVYLVGHSGGGGLSLMATANLPESNKISGVIALGPAVSPFFDYLAAVNKTDHGVWNFYSPLDFLFLGIGNILVGTMDHWHWPCAGMIRFSKKENPTPHSPQLVEQGYHPSMIRSWNFGGHFGYTNRLFIADHVAPVIVSKVKA